MTPGTSSNLNQKVYVQIEEWRNRKVEVEYPPVYLDRIYLKKLGRNNRKHRHTGGIGRKKRREQRNHRRGGRWERA